jgi:hypothetical protein
MRHEMCKSVKKKFNALIYYLDIIKYLIKIIASNSQRKHLFRFLESRTDNYFLEKPSPWLAFDAIDYLTSYLKKDMKVFEYGSGGSTLFWLSHGLDCVSIEHNPEWYKLICEKTKDCQKFDYRLIEPEVKENLFCNYDVSDPDAYISANPLYRDYRFDKYVKQIDSFPDEYFDVIVIDGRGRPSCIKHSVNKVKVGGALIVDNTERSYYLEKTKVYLSNFKKLEFYGVTPLNTAMLKTDCYLRIK